jgi:hypothetical protein
VLTHCLCQMWPSWSLFDSLAPVSRRDIVLVPRQTGSEHTPICCGSCICAHDNDMKNAWTLISFQAICVFLLSQIIQEVWQLSKKQFTPRLAQHPCTFIIASSCLRLCTRGLQTRRAIRNGRLAMRHTLGCVLLGAWVSRHCGSILWQCHCQLFCSFDAAVPHCKCALVPELRQSLKRLNAAVGGVEARCLSLGPKASQGTNRS